MIFNRSGLSHKNIGEVITVHMRDYDDNGMVLDMEPMVAVGVLEHYRDHGEEGYISMWFRGCGEPVVVNLNAINVEIYVRGVRS